jgi:hypothetical protein
MAVGQREHNQKCDPQIHEVGEIGEWQVAELKLVYGDQTARPR